MAVGNNLTPDFTYAAQPYTGYVSSIIPGGQWVRGVLPSELMAVDAFGLSRPSAMREPGTNMGTASLADRTIIVRLSQD